MNEDVFTIYDNDGNPIELEVDEVFFNEDDELINSEYWGEEQWKEVNRQIERKNRMDLDERNNQEMKEFIERQNTWLQ